MQALSAAARAEDWLPPAAVDEACEPGGAGAGDESCELCEARGSGSAGGSGEVVASGSRSGGGGVEHNAKEALGRALGLLRWLAAEALSQGQGGRAGHPWLQVGERDVSCRGGAEGQAGTEEAEVPVAMATGVSHVHLQVREPGRKSLSAVA
jgi:hypothetical protein